MTTTAMTYHNTASYYDVIVPGGGQLDVLLEEGERVQILEAGPVGPDIRYRYVIFRRTIVVEPDA